MDILARTPSECSQLSSSGDIYLDNNATTRPLPEVVTEVVNAIGDGFGNPASAHARGRDARQIVEAAREHVAALVGANPEQLIFTSGGTEANNLALHCVSRGKYRRMITTEAEHSSILSKALSLMESGASVVKIPVGADGVVELEALREELRNPADLVSVHWANSETGVVQPIEEIAEICDSHRVPLHVDAVQAVGRIPIAFSESSVTMLTMTAHKLHGPPGVGVLCIKPNFELRYPIMFGGDQERGVRPGTHNLPGIAGFGKATDMRSATLDSSVSHLRALRDRFEEIVVGSVEGSKINGCSNHRVCNTSNICFVGSDGMALMANLDREGVACSQSSACTSMRPEPSHVLRAMGLSEDEAFSSVRFSFSVLNTLSEAEQAAERVVDVARRLSSVGC